MAHKSKSCTSDLLLCTQLICCWVNELEKLLTGHLEELTSEMGQLPLPLLLLLLLLFMLSSATYTAQERL